MTRINKQETKEDYYNHFPLSDYFDFDIRPYTSLVKFDNEEAILQEGEKPNYLYYMIDGRAKLFLLHENGRISLINFLNAPCFIGEMELLGAQEAANGVTAITPCTCYAVHINDCRDSMVWTLFRHPWCFLPWKAGCGRKWAQKGCFRASWSP